MESSDSRSLLIRFAKVFNPNTLVKVLSGAAVLWTFLDDDGSIAAAVHRAFYREAWDDAGFSERLMLWLGFLLCLPLTPVISAVLTRRCGPRVRRATGKSLLRQAGEQLAMAGRHAVPPPWYYIFELYEEEHGSRAMEYLYRFETKAALYDILRKRLSDPVAANALSDKAAFARRCHDHGAAVVPALATVHKGRVQRLDGEATGLPACDLFLKPLRGAGGRGASRWTYGRDGLYHGNRGTVLDEAGLIDYMAELSGSEDYVVRKCVNNHHAIAALAGSALSTVRVVTCIDENGRPEVTHAVLRMASSADVVVDNFHAGGIAAAVDLATGELGPATDMGLRADSRWWDTHPVSGATIKGSVLPLWEQVPDLARRAHEAFEDQVAIGWDIAICEEGPLLVEGNKSPDLDIIQRIYRAPLGNTRFGELLFFHIQRALEVAATGIRPHAKDAFPVPPGPQ